MRIFIATVAVLCMAQLPGNHAKVRIFEKSFVRKKSYEDFSMDGERLSHVECDEQKPIRCQMEQLTIPYEDARYSCKFSLKEDITNQQLSFDPFGIDKLIIAQYPVHELVLSILHLAECRMSKELRLPRPENDLRKSHIGGLAVTYDDTFDVFFHDADSCGDKECKVTIDTEGKLIAGPVPIINHENGGYIVNNILPIAAQSPEKGYVYGMRKDGRDILSFLQPNGTEIPFVQDVIVNHVNTNNEQIGVCFALSYGKNVMCAQYDRLGNIKVQKDFSAPDRYVMPFYLYNLPKGGFLSLVIAGPAGVVTDISVRKVNAVGEQIGKITIKPLDAPKEYLNEYIPEMFSSRTHIWKDEGSKQYCVALIGKYIYGGYGLIVNCFDNIDLLK